MATKYIPISPLLADRIIESGAETDPRHAVEIVAEIRDLLDNHNSEPYDYLGARAAILAAYDIPTPGATYDDDTPCTCCDTPAV